MTFFKNVKCCGHKNSTNSMPRGEFKFCVYLEHYAFFYFIAIFLTSIMFFYVFSHCATDTDKNLNFLW